MSADRPVIGIIGCGLIGVSWGGLFASFGHDVIAWDPDAAARATFAARGGAIITDLVRLGLAQSSPHGRLAAVDDLATVARAAALIQENGPERVDLKRTLYAEVEALAAPDTIIASSTSSLTWPELFSEAVHPQRCITAHPFNPPHLVPLVEIYGIDRIAVDRASALYRGVGRVPVILNKPATGHIANRMASALWREAVNMVAEGIADVEAIDAALVNGPGLRWSIMGAHMAYHLGGGPGGIEHYLKHLGPSQERRWASLGNPNLTPEVCQAIIDGVARETEGRSIAELEHWRDENLAAVLKGRRTLAE